MSKYSDVCISDFGEENVIKFLDIQIFEDTPKYNSTMRIFVKNGFLQCDSEAYIFHSNELLSFFSKIKEIYNSLSGNVHLESVEATKCVIDVRITELGNFVISGTLCQLFSSNKCQYSVSFDQTCFSGKLSAF